MNVPEFMHLNDVKQSKDDFHADIWLRRIQINEQQTISFRRPDGLDSQFNLSRNLREGTMLKLAGKGVGGKGNLVLQIRLIDF